MQTVKLMPVEKNDGFLSDMLPATTVSSNKLMIRAATIADTADILRFILELAEYEKLRHEVVATETSLGETLFGNRPAAEVLLAEYEYQRPVAFALFFHTYSTFLGKPGMHLEDLYVTPAYRNRGIGRQLLAYIGQLACERQCGRVEWSVLDWNQDAIRFYKTLDAVALDDWTVFRVSGLALERMASGTLPSGKKV